MVNVQNFVKLGKKIVGVGINYKSVIRAKNLPTPEKPIVFMKPTTSYITEGQSIKIPESFTITQEVELGVVIGKTCYKVKESDAMKYVGGYCVVLDMTASSELVKARKAGLPWTLCKCFDTACPVSRLLTEKEIGDPHKVQLWSSINGKEKQNANTSDFIFSIPKIISFLTETITLEECDLLITGTSPGACQVKSGEVVEIGIKDLISQIAREKGLSWTLGKGFDTSCPVSRFLSLNEIKDPHDVELWCKVNGKLRQKSNTNDLFFNIPQLISYTSQYITLDENDLFITGTPLGNAPVDRGDVIEAGITGLVSMKFKVE